MLVRAGQKENLLPCHALIPGNHIRCDGFIGMAYVGVAIRIIDRRGDIKSFPRRGPPWQGQAWLAYQGSFGVFGNRSDDGFVPRFATPSALGSISSSSSSGRAAGSSGSGGGGGRGGKEAQAGEVQVEGARGLVGSDEGQAVWVDALGRSAHLGARACGRGGGEAKKAGRAMMVLALCWWDGGMKELA